MLGYGCTLMNLTVQNIQLYSVITDVILKYLLTNTWEGTHFLPPRRDIWTIPVCLSCLFLSPTLFRVHLFFSLPVFHFTFSVNSSYKPLYYSTFAVPDLHLIYILDSPFPDFIEFLLLLFVYSHWIMVPTTSADATFLCTLSCFSRLTFTSIPPVLLSSSTCPQVHLLSPLFSSQQSSTSTVTWKISSPILGNLSTSWQI